MASVKKGNYIVFFPSYQYMNRVREVCEGEYAYQNVELDDNEKMKNHSGKNGKSMEILVQDSHMTEEEREAFLQKTFFHFPHPVHILVRREEHNIIAFFCTCHRLDVV